MATIFENDSRRADVTSDLTTRAYDNLFGPTKFPFYLAIDTDYPSIDVCSHASILTDYK